MPLNRRVFVTSAAAFLAAPAIGGTHPLIRLRCIHTDNSCEIQYDGTISRSDYDAFKAVTRDWRRETTFDMDARLLDILSGISRRAGGDEVFDLISGYRMPETNNGLKGTAKASFHTTGQALDLRRHDISLRDLRTIALDLKVGGVGYYPEKHNRFVHVDTGRVRTW